MKIVCIQPKTNFGNTWEALGIGYLFAYLEKYGYSDIKFFSGFFDSDKEIIEGSKGADIIGFSCTSPQMKHALSLSREIKTNRNYVVFGGVHSSSFPEDCLEKGADAVVVGEGEQAFLEMVKGSREQILKPSYINNLVNEEDLKHDETIRAFGEICQEINSAGNAPIVYMTFS